MKQNFYKIIAIVSVLLGVLGPQVASGKTDVTSVPEDYNYTKVSLNVVSTPTSVGSVEVKTSSLGGCATQNESLRLDLLLWQGCNTLAIAPEESLPNLAVVSQPTSVPTLANESRTNYSQQESISSAHSQENFIIPISSLALRTPSFEKQSVTIAEPQVVRNNISSNQITQLNTVMLRC